MAVIWWLLSVGPPTMAVECVGVRLRAEIAVLVLLVGVVVVRAHVAIFHLLLSPVIILLGIMFLSSIQQAD